MNTLKNILILMTLSTLSVLSTPSFSAGNLNVSKEVSVNASIKTVWKMVGGFNALDVWHPVVIDSTLKSGAGSEPGDIRLLTLGNGATITEKLILLDDAKKTYTYAITESPLPVMDYVSTITVSESPEGMAKIEWASTFNANNAPDMKAVEAITGVYEAGLNNLVKHFNQ